MVRLYVVDSSGTEFIYVVIDKFQEESFSLVNQTIFNFFSKTVKVKRMMELDDVKDFFRNDFSVAKVKGHPEIFLKTTAYIQKDPNFLVLSNGLKIPLNGEDDFIVFKKKGKLICFAAHL